MMRTGLDREVGLDVRKFREKLLSRWDIITDFDNTQHCSDALEVMNSRIQTVNDWRLHGNKSTLQRDAILKRCDLRQDVNLVTS
jgi:hypothetical protein